MPAARVEPHFKNSVAASAERGRRSARPPIVALPPRRRARPLLFAIALVAVWGVIVTSVYLFHWLSDLPDARHLLLAAPSQDITILDSHGRLIARKGLRQGAMVDSRGLPPYVPNAFIAIEDRRFREHGGLDVIGMVRAGLEDLAAGHVVQGGSTITQQLAKNLFLKPDRTLNRKAQEAMLAIWLESHYSKDQILTLYLNRVYFGAGVYGIEAASERFFGKPAAELTLSEAAILAGSVKAPAKYNPIADRAAAQARAATVLKAMREAGFISEKQRRIAAATPPSIARPGGTPGAGYFADWVVSHVPGLVGNLKQPVVVQTTFDLSLQAKAERAVERGLDAEGARLHASQAALVMLAPDGAVRALVGGRSYSASPYDRATDAKRQPGSAFKPFVYLTALEHGHTLTDTLDDKPVAFGKWRPNNYENRYEGEVTLAHAFAKSSNSAAAQLTVEVGPKAVARTAHRLGIVSHLMAVPSLALGTETVTPLELVSAYLPFANGGAGAAPYAIREIRTKTGHVLYWRKLPASTRVMSAEHAADMARLMVGTVTEGTGRAARLPERPSAGKTGTTQDFRDAWFVGFTSDYVCGVWLGNDNNAPMKHASGGTLPARIFKSFMEDAERGLPAEQLTSIRLAPPPVSVVPVASQAATDAPQESEHHSAFEDLLNSLFGGH